MDHTTGRVDLFPCPLMGYKSSSGIARDRLISRSALHAPRLGAAKEPFEFALIEAGAPASQAHMSLIIEACSGVLNALNPLGRCC
jgi:hypothetical protein